MLVRVGGRSERRREVAAEPEEEREGDDMLKSACVPICSRALLRRCP